MEEISSVRVYSLVLCQGLFSKQAAMACPKPTGYCWLSDNALVPLTWA